MSQESDIKTVRDAARIRASVRGLVRRFSLSERADASCCGMTVAQAATLEALGSEGPLRLGSLGRRLGIAPSTLTRNLVRLEDRRLVERFPDPEDRRATVAGLTVAGKRAAADVEEYEARFAESILEAITPERRKSVVEGLGYLLEAVRDVTEQCCPGAYDHLIEKAGDGTCCPGGNP